MSDSAPSQFESSRRLTGPNLYFSHCGAVLEVSSASAEQCRAWELRVRTMRTMLAWPDDAVVAHVHASGASLALAAPEDQLFTATDLNEWAWQGVAPAVPALALPNAPGHPATGDLQSAHRTLRKLAAAEACPAAIALIDAAALHGLPAFYDEDALSIGAGQGSRSWLRGEIPTAVDWSALHDIPTALVTGSNGKTTTVRLISAMSMASGFSPGFNCTDGIFIAGEQVECGDYSGPAGARQVLRDQRVQAAILETARGGILRRGLAVRRANAAIITNISPDHFGEYGVHDLSDLADAKLVVARTIGSDGMLVLNADDPLLVTKSASLSCPLAWFSLDHYHPKLVIHRQSGGSTCAIANDRLLLHRSGITHDLGDIREMPLTVSGAALYNVANIAGAALLASILGVAPAVMAAVVNRFGTSREDNPGRLQRWSFRGVTVLVDYAHNPDGLSGLLQLTASLRSQPVGRLGLLLGQAGNRDDAAIRQLAAVAAAAKPELVVLKDLEGYMRGRESGEVPAILRLELAKQGLLEASVQTILDEVEAAKFLIAWALPGDVIILPVHNLSAREQLAVWLDSLVLSANR